MHHPSLILFAQETLMQTSPLPSTDAPVLTRASWANFCTFRRLHDHALHHNGWLTLMWTAGEKWAMAGGYPAMTPPLWTEFRESRAPGRLTTLDAFYADEFDFTALGRVMSRHEDTPETRQIVVSYLASVGLVSP